MISVHRLDDRGTMRVSSRRRPRGYVQPYEKTKGELDNFTFDFRGLTKLQGSSTITWIKIPGWNCYDIHGDLIGWRATLYDAKRYVCSWQHFGPYANRIKTPGRLDMMMEGYLAMIKPLTTKMLKSMRLSSQDPLVDALRQAGFILRPWKQLDDSILVVDFTALLQGTAS